MVLFNNKNIIQNTFPNNERVYNLPNKVDNKLTLIWESNEDLFNILFYKKMLDDLGYKDIILEMPFCCYAQMDRPINNMVFSFKYVAQLINQADFKEVIIYDPHSRVVEAAINRVKIVYPNLPRDYDLYFYPDNGSQAKYSEIYPKAKYRYGNKKRNLDTGEIIKYEVVAERKEIEGKKILIRDDLIIRGGTFKYAAKALKEMGAAQVDLYVTHTMPTARDFYEHLNDNYIDNYYTANTLQLDWIKNGDIIR